MTRAHLISLLLLCPMWAWADIGATQAGSRAASAASTPSARPKTVQIGSLCLKASATRCRLPILNERGEVLQELPVDSQAGKGLMATDLGNGMLMLEIQGQQVRVSRLDVQLLKYKQPLEHNRDCTVTAGVRASGC